LEGLSTSPRSKGSEHLGTEDEPVELGGVGRAESHSSILSGVVLVRGSGKDERSDSDLDAEGEVGNDPGDLEDTEGTREPSVTTVAEEVSTLVGGGGFPVLGLDSSIDGVGAGPDGGEDTRADGDE